MGYSVFWFGVADKPREQVLDELGLELGEETRHISDAPLVGVTVDNWFVVVVNFHAPVWYDDDALAALSIGTRVVRCEAVDSVMASSAAGFENGRRVWTVAHDEGQGLDHLETEGDLPPEFAEAYALQRQKHDAAVAEAAELGEEVNVDHMHDAPPELADLITGFRHDGGTPYGDEVHKLNALVEGLFSTVPVPRQPPPDVGDRPAPDASPGPDAEPRRSSRSGRAETEEEADARRLFALVAVAKPPPRLIRAVAFALDVLFALLLTVAAGFLTAILIVVLPGEPVYPVVLMPLALVGYMLLRDVIGKEVSPGKKGTEIWVLPPPPRLILKPLESIRRNLTLVSPLVLGMLLAAFTGELAFKLGMIAQLALIVLEGCLVLAGRERLGDQWAGTRVIRFPTLDEIKGRAPDPPSDAERFGWKWN